MNLGLGRGSMIDATGNPLDPRLVIATVVVGSGGAPGGSGLPGASGQPSAGPSEAPTESLAALVNPTQPVKVSVAPTSITLQAGMPARVFLIANSNGNISSVAADLTFDKNKIEVTGLEAGPAWGNATVIAVATGSNGLDAAIAQANSSGVLQQAGAFFPPGAQDLPYGEGVFVSVLVKAKADGTSSLSVGNAAALGVSGETIPVTIAATSFTKPPEKGLELDPTLVIPVVLLAIILLVVVLLIRSSRIPVRIQRRAPFYVSLLLGLIPVVLFAGVVLTLVVNSAPVVSNPGIPALFSSEPSLASGGQGSGLSVLPALWGSVLITLVAVIVALPISLALAIVAVDFPMGPITRLVRPLVGILSGIPPIVYAISVPIFITVIMIPKFAANSTFSTFDPAAVGANPATWPPSDVPYSAGGFPWDLTGVANSTLLGGLLIALFLVPFVTPLFVDALRDVPRAAREASLALGANRTYTLRRVVLPRALPALTGASMLAILKALGDTLIVAFAVGWSAGQLPQPLFDVLERTASLAAQGAGLLGSFETLDATCQPAQCAVGYSSALLLLLLAALVVIFVSHLQAGARRRVAT
jgi:phosphate transport system permease protein